MTDRIKDLEAFIDRSYSCLVTPNPSLRSNTLTSTMTTPSRHIQNKQSPTSSQTALWQNELTDAVFDRVMAAVSESAANTEERLSSRLDDALSDMGNNDFVTALDEENTNLREQCKLLEGRVTRLETETTSLREELLSLQARSMRDNLIFYNVPEPQHENPENTLRSFLRDEMSISEADLTRITCDRVHRLGKKTERTRPLIAKFNPSSGKDIIYKHTRFLNKQKRFGISEQLPRELEERKKRLLPEYKEAKRRNLNPKWSLDKLIINNKVKEIKKDTITDIYTDPTSTSSSLRPRHTQPIKQKTTTFQGHCVPITDRDEIIPALHALYINPPVARASYNPYAYRLRCGTEIIEHYDDDREWGAGRALLQVLRDMDIVDNMVCVSEWRGRTVLGPARFRHFADTARQALNTA